MTVYGLLIHIKKICTVYSYFCEAKLIRIDNSFPSVSYFVCKVFEVEVPVTCMCTASDRSRLIFHKHLNFYFSVHTILVGKNQIMFF